MKYSVVYLFCFFLGIGGYLGIRYHLTKTARPLLTDVQYTISPPTGAMVGKISKSDASVVKLRGPHDDDFKEVPDGTSVKQEDSVFVEKGSGVVVLPKRTFGMDEGSELFFENLMPEHVFLRQRSGDVTYEAEEPLSVRVQRSLVRLEKGSMDVTVDGNRGVIKLTSGTASLGNIDTDNNTTTYPIASGDRATVDKELQTVIIR